MASASKRVFETYELLENVLVLLDSPRKIFQAQRVCKTWCDIIQRSTTIQKSLFSAPTTDAVAPETGTPDGITRIKYAQNLCSNTFTPSFRLRVAYEFPRDDFLILQSDEEYKPHQHDPKATYRSTYLTQPPCTVASMGVLRSLGLGDWVHLTVRDPDGIRTGLLENLAGKFITVRNTRVPKGVKCWVGFSVQKTPRDEET